jgi:hypothetical protein
MAAYFPGGTALPEAESCGVGAAADGSAGAAPRGPRGAADPTSEANRQAGRACGAQPEAPGTDVPGASQQDRPRPRERPLRL